MKEYLKIMVVMKKGIIQKSINDLVLETTTVKKLIVKWQYAWRITLLYVLFLDIEIKIYSL